MRRRWLRIAVLVTATILVHEGWMATNGHAAVAASHTATAPDASHGPHQHWHHEASHARQDAGTEPPGSVPTHCEPLRVSAPANRDGFPALDTVPVATLPDPAILMLFAATSRDIVETPPPHPPDLIRAYYRVYRI